MRQRPKTYRRPKGYAEKSNAAFLKSIGIKSKKSPSYSNTQRLKKK